MRVARGRRHRLALWLGSLGLAMAWGAGQSAAEAERSQIQDLKVTVLSTMLTDTKGVGEWGFSALVEADDFSILYDTGHRSETVLRNAEELGVALEHVEDVVLSHNHGDHTGGLLTLRKALRERNEKSLSRVHAGAGLFTPRQYPAAYAAAGFNFPAMEEVRAEYEALGGSTRVYEKPTQLAPGVWLTGPVPRKHPEKNWTAGVKVLRNGEWQADDLVEDSALVIDTAQGLVVITGCGHAGVVNIVDYARTFLAQKQVHAVIGGLHLFAADDAALDWTAENLQRNGVQHLMGAHCTGLHATYRLRERMGLARNQSVVGAVGATFSLGEGFNPLRVAR